MPASSLKHARRESWGSDVRVRGGRHRLANLAKLASADIETSLVADLSDHLHTIFDPVCEDVLPIYFGPLLGRLYLEGL